MTTSLLLQPNDRIFVAGHRGMAGGAICRALQRRGYGDPAQGGALPVSYTHLTLPTKA